MNLKILTVKLTIAMQPTNLRSLLKKSILILLLALTASSLSACRQTAQPLHYGGQFYAEELLLQGMNFWSPYGLNIEHVLFKDPDELTQAFSNGTVDIALLSDIQAAKIFEQMGDQAVIIAVSERGNRMTTLVRADADIRSWTDLQGKKVALRNGSGVQMALKRYFAQHPELDWKPCSGSTWRRGHAGRAGFRGGGCDHCARAYSRHGAGRRRYACADELRQLLSLSPGAGDHSEFRRQQ
jgi:hypothetical protein